MNVVWENRQFGSIVWKQDKKFGSHFGVDFTNPDFVKLAEAFGLPPGAASRVEDFGRHLRHALTLDVPSLIVLPIDYSIDVAISEELGDGDGGSDMSTATVNAQEQAILDRVPKQLYIGGEWRDATSGGTLAVEDPATGETLAEVADATVDDAEAALGAAAPRRRSPWRDARRASAARSCAAPTTLITERPTTSRCS